MSAPAPSPRFLHDTMTLRFSRSALCAAACAASAAPSLRADETPPADPPATVTPKDFGALRGVVFFDDPAALEKTDVPAIAGADFSRAPGFKTPAAEEAARALIGRKLDRDLIVELRNRLSEAFASGKGAPTVRVSVPVQEVKDGVIRVALIRGRVGKVTVTGANWFSEDGYRRKLAVSPGDPVRPDQIDEGIADINRNRYRSASATLVAGEDPGTMDVALETREKAPFTFNAGYSDTGQMSTGDGRVTAGAEWGNAFGNADTLTYQFTASPGSALFRSHAAGYAHTFRNGHSVSLNANYAFVNSALPPPLNQSGESSAASLRYTVPLPDWLSVRNEIAFGPDYKRSNTNLVFSSMPVFDSLTEIVQGAIDYRAQRPDDYGMTGFTASLVGSPGGLAGANDNAAFEGQRAEASATYAYLNLSLSRTTRLPGKLTWTTTLRGQLSTDNLLGTEQLGFGGAASLRGYDEGEVYADQGLLVRNELVSPPLDFGKDAWAGSFQGFVFWDYGRAIIRKPVTGERQNYSLSSVGPGIRLSFTSHLYAEAAYGWQLIDTGLNPRGRESRGHVSVSATW